MDYEKVVVEEVHKRLGVIEKDIKTILAHTESIKWLKWQIRMIWGIVLGALGIKIGGH